MQLYLVKVIDSVIPRRGNAKVFLQSYVTMAASAIEAAENVMRENTVHPNDRIIVSPSNDLTMGLGGRNCYPNEIENLVGERFVGSDVYCRIG
jgi:hypothetical protein